MPQPEDKELGLPAEWYPWNFDTKLQRFWYVGATPPDPGIVVMPTYTFWGSNLTKDPTVSVGGVGPNSMQGFEGGGDCDSARGCAQRRAFWSPRRRERGGTAHAAGAEDASSSGGAQGTHDARFGGVPSVSMVARVCVCVHVLGCPCSACSAPVTSIIGPVLEYHFRLHGILLHDDFETF